MEKRIKIHLIAAARPNFMKIAPLYHNLKIDIKYDVKIIHTGQHYDKNMSSDFFDDLKLPYPDFNLGVGKGSQSEQVGNTMIEYEKICLIDLPDLIIVVGDVNATMACTITGKKLGIKVAHVEAGIRSFDLKMPEEINRMVTDSICDYFWTPSIDANDNLINEGISLNKIELVGNIMIDSLVMLKKEIIEERSIDKFALIKNEFAIVTFHRPSNVDERETLKNLVHILIEISKLIKVVFPLHPRTKSCLIKFNLLDLFNKENIIITEPMNYKSFMSLVFDCKLVVTDSGGIQEESTYLNIPCLTVRDNTERPITVNEGTNTLVGPDQIVRNVNIILGGSYKSGRIPFLWDGMTSKRIVNYINENIFK